MPKKKSLLVAVAVVILLVAGFFTYSQIHDRANQKDQTDKTVVPEKKIPEKTVTENPVTTEKDKPIDNQPKKSPVQTTDPSKKEIYIEGKVKSIDVEKRIVTINQLMDDNSKTINPNVPIMKDAIIQDKTNDILITQIKINDTVSMIITGEGQARAVLVNY